jgi:hypothetical protein
MEFYNKQKKFMREIDYLDIIVNSLNSEVDNLILHMDGIEQKLNIYERENQEENQLDN